MIKMIKKIRRAIAKLEIPRGVEVKNTRFVPEEDDISRRHSEGYLVIEVEYTHRGCFDELNQNIKTSFAFEETMSDPLRLSSKLLKKTLKTKRKEVK